MLRYELSEVQLGPTHYLLLPKLNPAQVEELGKLLRERGFRVEEGRLLDARKPGLVFHIDPVGVCWSTTDPADFILPLTLKLLGVRKDRVPLGVFRGNYYKRVRLGTKTTVRVSTRVETTPLWRTLRARGLCALTPDERAMVVFLAKLSDGCSLVTDFPTPSSRVRMIGKRQYFESLLDPQEIEETILKAGEKGSRNAYLPGDGTLLFDAFKSPRTEDFRALSELLGEWCYYRV